MINIFKHLLPTGKAWRITIKKTLRDFFDGLSQQITTIKTFFDGVYLDLFPQSTRELDAWEKVFGLPDSGMDEQARRDRLESEWAAKGGNDPRSIQDRLRAAGFDVYIHEAWEPIIGRSGGSINNDVTPVIRNPFLYLDDGLSGFSDVVVDGGNLAYDGGDSSYDGARLFPVGYPLVNKVQTVNTSFLSDGSIAMMDGGVSAEDGRGTLSFNLKLYEMPSDTDTFAYYIYIAGETFPDVATVPTSRREEFENMCLKICPLQKWIGVLVQYT